MASSFSISSNPAIKARFLMIDSPLEFEKSVVEFKDVVIDKLTTALDEIIMEAPAGCDIGRFIHAMDSINAAKHSFIESAILGEIKSGECVVPWDSKK